MSLSTFMKLGALAGFATKAFVRQQINNIPDKNLPVGTLLPYFMISETAKQGYHEVNQFKEQISFADGLAFLQQLPPAALGSKLAFAFEDRDVYTLAAPSNSLPFRDVGLFDQRADGQTYAGNHTAYVVQGNTFYYKQNPLTQTGWTAGPSLSGELVQDYISIAVSTGDDIVAVPASGAKFAFSAKATSQSARVWQAITLDGGNVHEFVKAITFKMNDPVSGNADDRVAILTNGINGSGADYLFLFNPANLSVTKVLLPVPEPVKFGDIHQQKRLSEVDCLVAVYSTASGELVDYYLYFAADQVWKLGSLKVKANYNFCLYQLREGDGGPNDGWGIGSTAYNLVHYGPFVSFLQPLYVPSQLPEKVSTSTYLTCGFNSGGATTFSQGTVDGIWQNPGYDTTQWPAGSKRCRDIDDGANHLVGLRVYEQDQSVDGEAGCVFGLSSQPGRIYHWRLHPQAYNIWPLTPSRYGKLLLKFR